MNRPLSSVLTALLLLLLPLHARADLDSDLRAILRDKFLARASVGVQVLRLGDAPPQTTPLFSHNAQSPLIPASNMKLVTTASALEHLGAGFKFQTLLVRHGNSLILVGDGDPTFGDGELLKRVGWTATTVYERWAAELKKAGLTHFDDVLLDDSVFDARFTHPNWDKRNLLARYSPGVAGMMLNQGVIDFVVRPQAPGQPVSFTTSPPTRYVTVRNTCTPGRSNAVILHRDPASNDIALRGTCPPGEVQVSITVHDPGLYAARVLHETVGATGKCSRSPVPIRSRLTSTAPDPAYTLLAVHETPLIRALEGANKDSFNPYAESLAKRIGFAVHGAGTWENGAAAAAAMLKRIGVPTSEFTLDDGSGLSRENRLSAAALCSVLKHQYHGRDRDLFLSSLALAAEDGTLEDRFKGPLRGRVHAKSGFINGVSALSGYLKAKDGRHYAFSILMNNVTSNFTAKQIQEAIVKAIDDNAT